MLQRQGQQPLAGGGADQGEALERQRDGLGVRTLVDHVVDLEVLHRRVQVLLDDAWQPMDLVDKEDVTRVEFGQHAHQIERLFQGRTRGTDQVAAHLVRHDHAQRRRAQ